VDALQLPVSNLLDGARARTEQARVQALADRERSGEDLESLRRTAREFEGVFVNQLLKSMRATVPESKLFNGGGATKFYQQMHDAELARSLAGGAGGMGMSDLIVQQFSGAVDREQASAPVSRPTALARYAVQGDAALQARRRGEMEALARRAEPAEIDTLRQWGNDLQVAAERHDVPPALLLAVIMEESGGDPDATSDKGARGLMQLMPDTAREMGVADPGQPGPNIAGGARYLSRQLERYEGRLDLALAAYNAGPGNVDRAGRRVPAFAETQRYVQRVTDRFHRLGGGTELANDPR
jgi:Rod binding domain-containing protein